MLVVALSVGWAVWLMLGSRRSGRIAEVMPSARRLGATTVSRPGLRTPVVSRIACAGAGLGLAIAMGGWLGALVGIGVAVAGPVVVSRLESGAARARRELLTRQAAQAADLLSACLASGATLGAGVDAVRTALGSPISEPLSSLSASLRLGTDPLIAWRALMDEPGLAPLARLIVRSLASGAPLADALPRIADDLRRDNRARAEAAARSAGVKAVAPLAACFLPAFLLMGVVPVVASLALPMITTWLGPR